MLSAMCALVHLVFDKTTQGICICSWIDSECFRATTPSFLLVAGNRQ
jgi:hypothetical protein